MTRSCVTVSQSLILKANGPKLPNSQKQPKEALFDSVLQIASREARAIVQCFRTSKVPKDKVLGQDVPGTSVTQMLPDPNPEISWTEVLCTVPLCSVTFLEGHDKICPPTG